MRLNKEQYAATFKTLHHAYELQAYKLVKAALDKQTKAVIAHIKENGTPLLGFILPGIVQNEVMREAYRKLYERIGVQHARYQTQWLRNHIKGKGYTPEQETKAIGIAFSSEYWRNLMSQYFLSHAASRVAEVDVTTVNNIKKLLALAQEQQMGLVETARFMTEELSSPDYNRHRAMRIARTESTTAANQAAQAVAEEAEFETEKVWIPVHDSRTRHSHTLMGSKEPIPLNQLFEVPRASGGVDYALYPGATGLSAENVVNCRCCHATIAKLDVDGLPIMRANSSAVAGRSL